MMFDRNSLVTQLGWRLGIVLSIGTLLQMAWLFVHFRGAETGLAKAGVFCELFDFFKDVAWTTPVIGVVTFIACAAGMRRHLQPLRQLSKQAARTAPGNGHELRTPAAVVQAGLERFSPSNDVLVLRRETERMGRIVGQLLSLARLEGCNGVARAKLDAARIVRRAAEPLVDLASAAHVRLAFEVEQEPVQVLGTEEAITEIARNLVENAIGHAPANTEVTIGLSRRGLLSIADCGPGIPKDQRNRLFERFWRGSWTSRPGSGLGLAIVAE